MYHRVITTDMNGVERQRPRHERAASPDKLATDSFPRLVYGHINGMPQVHVLEMSVTKR